MALIIIVLLSFWVSRLLNLSRGHIFFVAIAAMLALNPDGTLNYPVITVAAQALMILYVLLILATTLLQLFKMQFYKSLYGAVIDQLNGLALILIAWTSVFISEERGLNTTFFIYTASYITVFSVVFILFSLYVEIHLFFSRNKVIQPKSQ